MKRIFTALAIMIFLATGSYAVDENTVNVSDVGSLETIGMGVDIETLAESIGQAERVDASIYGFDWHLYVNGYINYYKLGVDQGKVVSIFSKSPVFQLVDGIYVGNTIESVETLHGKPLDYYGRDYAKKYEFEDFDMIIFIDRLDENRILSWMAFDSAVDYDLVFKHRMVENVSNTGFDTMKISYVNQVVDLVNVQRVLAGLNALELSDTASDSAQKHSDDMAKNNFFDHINKSGQTPFDRMKSSNVRYKRAGENIAYGYENPAFVHEAWMNSSGHRKNVMNEYDYIGIGIGVREGYRIYYTQNFYK